MYLEKLAVRTAESSVLIDGEIRHYLETPAFNIAASSDKLTVGEFGGLVPALAGSTLQPALEVKTAGPLSDLQLEANVRSSAGNVKGHVRGDMESEARTARGSVQIAHVDPGRLLNRADLAGDVTADATFDVRGTAAEILRGRVDISAPSVRVARYQLQSVKANAVLDGARTTLRASARGYGASATIRGRITRHGTPLGTDRVRRRGAAGQRRPSEAAPAIFDTATLDDLEFQLQGARLGIERRRRSPAGALDGRRCNDSGWDDAACRDVTASQ